MGGVFAMGIFRVVFAALAMEKSNSKYQHVKQRREFSSFRKNQQLERGNISTIQQSRFCQRIWKMLGAD